MPRVGRVWSYVSDVEGNLRYWNKFINLSKVLFRKNDGKLALCENSGFIFGGDAVDKGQGDIRVVRDLLQLKEDYYHRVHLLIGNRDANKLRFASELEQEVALATPYWIREENRVSYSQYLTSGGWKDDKVHRMKWMLAYTMGSETTFQNRKQELEILGRDSSDEAVVQSYLDSITPGGEDTFMLNYLKSGSIMVIIGSTVVVHGGIHDTNFGTVPGDDVIREDVNEWASDLNGFAKLQLQSYENYPYWRSLPDLNTGIGNRGGDSLIRYGIPGKVNRTVVYSSFLKNGNPRHVSEKTTNYLNKNGIHRVFVGHVPHGDCPTVIATDKLQVLLADTSYSDMSKHDNRGDAVSEILLNEDDQSVFVHGVLKDNREIQYYLDCPGKFSNLGDSYVGKQLKDGYWVKSKLADSDMYLICKGEGHALSYKWMTPNELQENIISNL